jgi:glyoxylase-like metal-dependent hydrolase (beta-lactamase superfamily II)
MLKIIPYINGIPRSSGDFLSRNPAVSYLLSDGKEGGSAALIDAGVDPQQVNADINKKGCLLEYVLITHYHTDHICKLTEIVKKFPEVTIGIHPLSLDQLLRQGFKRVFSIRDNMKISLGNSTLTALFSPGHTSDSICYLDADMDTIFTGDTLLGGGIGCCDYGNGGSRNKFYLSVNKLLKLLPQQSKIYPGHYSEYYNVSPPYLWALEKDTNPYLVNAVNGKYGDFDRELKKFSSELEMYNYALLNSAQIDAICSLEKATWIPELQASRDTILQRLELGHTIFGLKIQGELLGMIGWRYSDYSPQDTLLDFPQKFTQFTKAVSVSHEKARSAFIYNVGVKVTRREKGLGSLLLQGAFEKIRSDGIHHVFVDSRIPSYRGSQKGVHEQVNPIPEFASAVNRYFSQGRFPLDSEYILDPTVRFYINNGFKPWTILRDFIPDESSGNMRIICYVEL